MATIQNEADVALQATSPRLLSNQLNYISVIPTTNTVTVTSGALVPTSVTVKAVLNGVLRGTISWNLSPAIAYTPITDGIVINSANITTGTSVIVTASITFAGTVYTNSTTITRKQAVTLSTTGVLTGENGGSITNLDYTNVGGTKPPANATANFFTTSASDPTGGANGDAHYNSATNVMWFKVSGVWTKGGTINASQITVGTLAAARIAAGTITTDKLVAGTLNAFTINSGAITGTSNINITGSGIFNGSSIEGTTTHAILANTTKAQSHGVKAYAGGLTGSAAIYGVADSASGIQYGALFQHAGASGGAACRVITNGLPVLALQAYHGGGGTALSVVGNMTMSSPILVANLNADMVDGLHATKFVRTDTNSIVTGNINVTGAVQMDNLQIDITPITGAATATFPGNNKPGVASTCKWLPIFCNGVVYYFPGWT